MKARLHTINIAINRTKARIDRLTEQYNLAAPNTQTLGEAQSLGRNYDSAIDSEWRVLHLLHQAARKIQKEAAL